MGGYSRVDITKLTESRLDSAYYSRRFLGNEAVLENCGLKRVPIGELSALCNCGATPKNVVYGSTGTGLIRTSDVRPNEFHARDVVRTEDISPLELRSSIKAVPGDLLYTMSGTIGYACVIPDTNEAYSFSNTIARVRLPAESENDTHYVAAFFNSFYGYEQSLRLTSGGIQGHVMPNPFKALKISLPHAYAQKYIGDKVRQAEQLRTWAKQVEIEVSDFHKQLIPDQSNLNFNKKTRLVTPLRMTERLDAHFYPAVVDDYITSHNATFAPLGKLSRTVFNGQTQDGAADSVAIDQITVMNLSPTYVKGEARRVYKPATDEKYTKKHDLLVCNAAHNKSYIGRNVTYCHSEKPFLPSTEVMVIRVNRDEIPASFVRTYLLSRLGFVQIQSTIRGITAHSYPTDMKKLDIPVPEVPDELRHAWFTCDERMASAGYACEIANKLTTAAKLMVEALIEGRLTEQHLIDAQKALEVGEMCLDRSILERLTNTGIDNDGESLFPDLDQLYDLLAKSQSPDE